MPTIQEVPEAPKRTEAPPPPRSRATTQARQPKAPRRGSQLPAFLLLVLGSIVLALRIVMVEARLSTVEAAVRKWMVSTRLASTPSVTRPECAPTEPPPAQPAEPPAQPAEPPAQPAEPTPAEPRTEYVPFAPANAPAVTPSAPVLQIYQDPNRLKSVPEIQEVASDESDGGSSAPEEPPAVPSRTARRGKSK